MAKTILLQSFRNYDVPAWIGRCQDSVKCYAGAQNWEYSFAGDDFFDWAPSWIKDSGDQNIYVLSDICRLEWMKHELKSYDSVVWADIDMLVIYPSRIAIDPNNSYGFSYELCFTEHGWQHGINNAFMFFRKGSDMLTVYMEKCYEILRESNAIGDRSRTVIGPDLLKALDVPESHIIPGLNVLNARDLFGMYRTSSKDIPAFISAQTKSPIGAVNLCLNERSLLEERDRVIYDHVLDTVSTALLSKSSHFGEGPLKLVASKQLASRRNQPCPCGSNKRYKHCHGLTLGA